MLRRITLFFYSLAIFAGGTIHFHFILDNDEDYLHAMVHQHPLVTDTCGNNLLISHDVGYGADHVTLSDGLHARSYNLENPVILKFPVLGFCFFACDFGRTVSSYSDWPDINRSPTRNFFLATFIISRPPPAV